MTVYRVMLTGRWVVVKSETGDETCGFVRNEYVWASNEGVAALKARQKVMKRLAKKQGVSVVADAFNLSVDEVEPGFPVSKLAANESFIFFNPDSDSIE